MAGTPHTRGQRRGDGRGWHDSGFMMVAILIGMGVAAIMMTAALPSWRQQVQRTREEDLIFRGEQYARAIVLYQIKNRCARPPSIDVLVSQHYLRKKWKDPVTNDDFDLVGIGIVNMPGQGPLTPVGSTPQGGGSARGGSTPVGQAGQPGATRGGGAPIAASGQQPGLTGVRSKSAAASIKVYQQQQQYNYWPFDAALMAQKMGVNLNAACNPQQQGGRQGGQGQPGAGRGGQQGGGVGPGGQPGRGGGTGPGRGGTPPPPPTGVGRGGRGGGL